MMKKVPETDGCEGCFYREGLGCNHPDPRTPECDGVIYVHEKKHAHYFKDVSHLQQIDVYAILKMFDVTDPCVQHAVKKLLVAGGRGAKDTGKDIQEAIDTLERWKEMQVEFKAL